jgi:hypothetical protein
MEFLPNPLRPVRAASARRKSVNIELCAEWCCETASASEVAVNAIEGDGSDGECDGCEVGCESVAEVREQSHGGKCSGDSR